MNVGLCTIYTCLEPEELKRGARLLGTGVRVGGEPSCGCWGPNWESSKPVLLTPEWSLWLTRDGGREEILLVKTAMKCLVACEGRSGWPQ